MSQLYIKVKPDADEFDIDTSGTHPQVSLEAPAEQGRANAELKRRLGELLDQDVGIVSGHRSSLKKIAVDMGQKEVEEILASCDA